MARELLPDYDRLGLPSRPARVRRERREVRFVSETVWRKATRRCGGYTGEDGEACVEIAVVGMR